MRRIKIILVLAIIMFTQVLGEADAANGYLFGEGTKYGKSSKAVVKGDLHKAGAGSGEDVTRDAWHSRAFYMFENIITGEKSLYLEAYGMQIVKQKGDDMSKKDGYLRILQ